MKAYRAIGGSGTCFVLDMRSSDCQLGTFRPRTWLDIEVWWLISDRNPTKTCIREANDVLVVGGLKLLLTAKVRFFWASPRIERSCMLRNTSECLCEQQESMERCQSKCYVCSGTMRVAKGTHRRLCEQQLTLPINTCESQKVCTDAYVSRRKVWKDVKVNVEYV